MLGYKPSLKKPTTYNEKVVVFKLDADRPIYRDLADKITVRQFVSKRLGSGYLIPFITTMPHLTYEIYERLPRSFVIKANHGSAMNCLVFDKQEYSYRNLKKMTDSWIARNFYVTAREKQYKHIRPKLLVEELLLDDEGRVPDDYKIHCFTSRNGDRNIIIQVDKDRHGSHVRNHYDAEWNFLPLKAYYPNSIEDMRPDCAKVRNKLIETAWALADGFAYVRVDLYVHRNHVYFGEMTFTPAAGHMIYEPSNMDEKLGQWFDLERQLSLFTMQDLSFSSNQHQRKERREYKNYLNEEVLDSSSS
ncbi:ATP-grasp fold amidoligase family protein [Halomonas shantousis]